MSKGLGFAIVLSCLLIPATFAVADSIGGRVGITGRIGYLVPAESELYNPHDDIETDAGYYGGGGLIFGIGNNFALEVEATHTSFEGDVHHDKFADFDTTNLSFGAQYRFMIPRIPKLVPYAGAGVDVLFSDSTDTAGNKAHIDTVVGGHFSGGVDYFVLRNLALNAEAKAVFAPEADIVFQGVKQGDFDPSGFSMTFGIRFFFN